MPTRHQSRRTSSIRRRVRSLSADRRLFGSGSKASGSNNADNFNVENTTDLGTKRLALQAKYESWKESFSTQADPIDQCKRLLTLCQAANELQAAEALIMIRERQTPIQGQ